MRPSPARTQSAVTVRKHRWKTMPDCYTHTHDPTGEPKALLKVALQSERILARPCFVVPDMLSRVRIYFVVCEPAS